MPKKFFTLLLCLIMLLPLIVSCADNGNDVSSGDVDASDSESGEESISFPRELPDGRTFDETITILCLPSSRHTYAELQFVPDAESSGNAINDAVQERNNIIESEYGIEIKIAAESDPYTVLYNSVTGGLDEYQLVCNSVNNMLPYAGQSMFLSLNDEVLLDQDYWDINAINNLRITDDVFFLAGDAIICDDEYSYCVIYNKDIYEDDPACIEAYGDIYELVRSGGWTYDALYAMAKAVTLPDDDGNYKNENCTYGLLTEGYAAEMLVAGSGNTSFIRRADGGFDYNMETNGSLTAFNKVFDIATDKQAAIMVDDFSSDGWKTISSMFAAGKGLFYTTSVASISTITDVNFGVVPMPKADEKQENYYSGINIYQTEVLAVPSSNLGKKHDATMFLLDALGYWSKHTPGQNTVTEAYYETTLKLQKLTTYDDEEMLDTICNSRLYDIGYIFNWGGVLNIWASTIRSGQNTGASTVNSQKDAAVSAMQTTVDEYGDIVS